MGEEQQQQVDKTSAYYRQLMDQKLQNIGQRQAESVSVPDYASDPEMVSKRQEYGSKLQELFKYDTNLANVYFQPQEAAGPHAEGYQPPQETLLDPSSGMMLSSKRVQSTANELADILDALMTRKGVLETAYERQRKLRNDAISDLVKEFSLIKDLYSVSKSEEEEERTRLGEMDAEADERTLDEMRRYFASEVANEAEGRESYRAIVQRTPAKAEAAALVFEEMFGKPIGAVSRVEDIDPIEKSQVKTDVASDAITSIGKGDYTKEEFIRQQIAVNGDILTEEEIRSIVNPVWPETEGESEEGSFMDWLTGGKTISPVPGERSLGLPDSIYGAGIGEIIKALRPSGPIIK